MARPSLRRLPTTVRGRSTALAVLVVAVALLAGTGALLLVFRSQLINSLDQTLQQQVDDRAALLDQGSSPQSLTGAQQEEALVWIGTPDGRTVAANASVIPQENPVPAVIGQALTVDLLVEEVSPNEVELERMTVRLYAAPTADGLVVVAGAEIEQVDKSVLALAQLFAVFAPLLLLVVGALTWYTTGRALAPVEGIRARAAAISGTSLTKRVPVPPGQDEIAELAKTMNAMLDRIESHEYSLRQFTADASHELKSPVANLRALVETADIDGQGWSTLQGQLVGESERLRDLVDNLLFLASHEAGRRPEATGTLALDELLFTEAELLAAKGDVVVDLAGVEPVQVRGAVADLSRMVRNLVDNAARHARSRVSLAVSSDDDGGATLVVGDDGPGIAPQDRQRVFERFTRLDDARARNDGGAGLGLAIVSQIAAGHNATVSIDQSPLGGARLRVHFPGRGSIGAESNG